ncbi:ABC transporter ATP-binding protein [Desulfurococcaceae archaeon MEX13E-LK6-19]|nr:ABC transporter ATP-binding protein [Desulfurococcaceae archaeon MEX13E-LK6-19]
MYAIVVDKLVKYYGKTKAVDNLSFTVKKGEVYAILGPNGAGKTTTIKSIAGLIKFNSGKITVLGKDVSKETLEIKKMIGVMPELPNLFGDLSVRENLEFLARLYGLDKKERRERISYIVELLNLKYFLNKKYDVLSKGLKRRVDLAAALLHDPEILILDEPTSGLDVKYAVTIRLLIRDLAEKGKTILLTTHNIPEAMELADKVLIINKGKKIVEGEPGKLKDIAGLEPAMEIVFNDLTDDVIDEMYRLWGENNVRIRGVLVKIKNVGTTKVLKDLAFLIEKYGVVIEQVNTSSTPWDEVLLRILHSGEPHE